MIATTHDDRQRVLDEFTRWCADRVDRFDHQLNCTIGRIIRDRKERTQMDYESRGNTLHAPGGHTHDDITANPDY